MPFTANESRDFVNEFQGELQPKPPGPGIWDTFEAGFKMENPVLNGASLLNRPTFLPQEGFNIGPWLREYDGRNGTNIFEEHRDRFLGVQSEEEALYSINSLKEENNARDTLSRAGWLGVVAGVTGGLVSPEIFIPFVGEARGLKAVGTGLALGLASAAPSSAILYENQISRKPGDVAFDLAASTALGGILGGAAGFLRKGEQQALEAEIVQASRPNLSIGAAQRDLPDAGGLAYGAKTAAKINDKTGFLTNPVTQTINQEDLPEWRRLMSVVSDSGLELEGNRKGVAALEGGTIENRTITWTGPLVKAIEGNDEAYAKYFFEGNAPKIAPNARAWLSNTFNGSGKLSRAQFKQQVMEAIWEGFDHPIPEVVAAAKQSVANVFEPMLKEAQTTGLIAKDIELVGDKAYAQRIYNVTAIQTRTQEFLDKLTQNYEKQLGDRFVDELGKMKASQAKKTQLAEDLEAPQDIVDQHLEKFKDELKAIDENLPEDIQNLEEAISTSRATARSMLDNPETIYNEATRKQLLKDARDMENSSEAYKGIKERRGYLRRRISNLNKSVVAVDAKRAAKLERIGRVEELNLASMQRVIKKAQTTLAKLDSMSDEKLDAELEGLRNQFASVSKIYDRGEEQLTKIAGDDELVHKVGALEDLQQKRAERLDDISGRLEAAEGLDRESIRNAIQYGLDKTMLKVEDLNRRRVLRRERLQEQLKTLDPEVARARLREVRDSIPKMEDEFVQRWEGPQYQADSVDVGAGSANFKTIARQSAENVKDTIVGTYNRLPYSEVLGKERGAELARVLDIPSREIADFLEKDIDKVLSIYTRTLAPDIELKRVFGSFDWRQIIQPAVEERAKKLDEIAKAVDKKGEPRPQAWKDKETKRINDAFDLHSRNFAAVVSRLRGTRGLPAEPDGFAYRAARTIMQLNTLRMMGMVTTASVPDVGRPVMRYGLTRVFRDGFVPLITNLKAMKMSMREGILAGAAAEVTTHTRAAALHDITNGMVRGSAFEKAVDWASTRMGQIALFDYWTQGGKMLTSAIANAKLMESLEKVATGNGLIRYDEAVNFLAQNGITGNLPQDIWKEVLENGGGGKVNGVWWPNTESWKSGANVQAYRAALAREVNNTIVSPGVEKPLFADANIAGRMLYQFKSFGMSATPKILLSGMQQRDGAILSGSMASLALGALSYYLWAVASGGKAYTEMQNAGIDKWADEAISRSGLTAGFGEIQRVAQTVPGLSSVASFSGGHQTRRPGDNLTEALLGPSFDFLKTAGGVISGLGAPTQGTVKQFFNLLPFQNTMGLREGLEAVEAAIASKLPERRN